MQKSLSEKTASQGAKEPREGNELEMSDTNKSFFKRELSDEHGNQNVYWANHRA